MRGAAWFLALCLLSGCLGGRGPSTSAVEPGVEETSGTPAPKSTANATVEERPELEAKGQGAVEGIVRDEFEARVANAHVALLGTDAFKTTDTTGTFSFQNLTAGGYALRVDHERFLSLELEITVEKGKATVLEVRLAFPVESFPGYLGTPHRHDWWGDDREVVIMDRYVSMGTTGVCATVTVQNGCYSGFLVDNTLPTKNYPESRIVFTSPADESQRPNIVFEGTGKLAAQMELEGNVVHPFDIHVVVPGETGSRKVATVTTTKASFEVPVFENNTDPPHFRRSGWEFYIYPSKGGLPAPAALYQGRMHWKVTVHRSDRELPVGGAHPDYWGSDTVRTLLTKTCDVVRTPAATSGCGDADLPENKTVTIGTAIMVVTLSWTQDLVVPVKVGLEYIGADVTSNTYYVQWYRPTATQDGDTRRVFKFDVRADQWDSPYVYKSAWRFRHFIDNPTETGAWDGTITYNVEIHKQQ
ncbi:MAG: carboxypeptidase regulatory-like domain-containing protein [Euryarchaeota archaeon]|nr:carboxypeptidase regulatory-like domain-containing protein [Euryarchaeota archaeon]